MSMSDPRLPDLTRYFQEMAEIPFTGGIVEHLVSGTGTGDVVSDGTWYYDRENHRWVFETWDGIIFSSTH